MVTNEMCAFIGKAHEFFLALKKAGFTDELIQEIINSKDNVMAQKMFESLQTRPMAQAATSIFGKTASSFVIFGTIAEFVAKDNFVVNIDKKAKVKIAFLNDDFIKWFLGKTEEPFPGSTIWKRKLEKRSTDNLILAELGGQEKAETTLFELFIIMKRQAKGENGRLLNNGWANIFYIRDINGILRAVDVRWMGNGWGVRACSVENPGEWNTDRCVFSHAHKTIQQ